MYHLEQERGLSILYLSPLAGLETKVNLKFVSENTDEALALLNAWPVNVTRDKQAEFMNKRTFQVRDFVRVRVYEDTSSSLRQPRRRAVLTVKICPHIL
jgi:hypothetical protein